MTAPGAATLERRLARLRRRHRVPGASVAVLAEGTVATAAAGVLSVQTRQRVTVDSKFQIGSTTKTYVATLVMQLVDAGRIGLDDRVDAVLGGSRFGADDQARDVTVRQLLTHTSGVFGDFYGDFGRGDEAVARYVDACADLAQVVAPGATFSYCNAGFIALGRMVELLTEQPFNTALRSRLLAPIGAHESAPVPEEAILGRVAVGHFPVPTDLRRRMVAPVWSLPDALTPAGALLCTSARDLLRWGQVHLANGATEDSSPVVSAGTAAAMRRTEVRLPSAATRRVTGWGLGWTLFDLGDVTAFGHDGASLGQESFLRVIPEAGVGFALLVNGPFGEALFDELFAEVLDEVASIRLDMGGAERARDRRPTGVDRWLGTYRQPHLDITLRDDDGALVADFEPRPEATGLGAAADPTVGVPVHVAERHEQVVELVADVTGAPTPMTLSGNDARDGRPAYLHSGFRAFPRV